MEHIWKPRAGHWLQLQGPSHALVRVKPMHDGKFLWQFRNTVSFADTVDQAKDYVEAGAEYFETMRRNPYGA